MLEETFHWSSPDRVLNIFGVKGKEEAEDGEEHDTVGCKHQATSSAIDHSGELHRGVGCCVRGRRAGGCVDHFDLLEIENLINACSVFSEFCLYLKAL